MNDEIFNTANSWTNNQAVKGGQEGYQGVAKSNGSLVKGKSK
jgi:hypothetical protein